jgi:ATP-dependent helicase/nuclease subunit B
VPVQFVIGRAGSGKTHRCLTSIAEMLRADPLGPAVFWIVPKQATFMAERMLTCTVGAFCRARVVSFEQLGKEIFAYAGGNVIPEVTPLGRQMVIGHLLRQLKPRLKFFASSARQPGLAAELDAAFAEFERSGKTSAELATLIDELDAAKPVDVDHVSLLAKLRDIRLVYDAYTKYLGQERLDQHQRLQQVLGCIDGCPPLRGTTVFVDGFTEFSDHERRLLAGIAKVCARMEVMLLVDAGSAVVRDPHALPDESGLFHQTEQTFRKLWFTFAEQDVPVDETVRLDDAHRFAEPTLARLERDVFADRRGSPVAATPASQLRENGTFPAHGVELTIAPDRQAEVDAVARGIRKLWREGFRLRDIAVIVRDVEPYHALVDASFREHGIEYFVDRRRSAAHHPLLQLVRAIFQVVRYDWPNEPMFALMKSGLAGVTPAEADEVENYVNLHHLRRAEAWEAAEPWTYRRHLTRGDESDGEVDEKPETIDALRRQVIEPLRPSVSLLRLNESLTVRDLATELFTVLDRFRVRETLAGWADAATAADDPEQAAEHEQVWAEFVDLCEQAVDLLGNERVALADFVDILESGLERFDLALTPPTVDEVLVGAVDRTRCPPDLKAVFVLGLNEGEFPRVAAEPSVLTEPERRALRKRDVELGTDKRRQLADENLLGYIAFTRASGRLIVSRTRADDDGRPVNASRFWEMLRESLPGVEPVEIPRDANERPAFIETPRQVLVGLMRWARAIGAQPLSPAVSPKYRGEAVWSAVYQWLATHSVREDAIGRMRDVAWRAIGYANEATLASDLAARLFGTPLEASARQLETFAACPFKHFVRFGLGITGSPSSGVTALDLSQVYHQVLDVIVGEVLEKKPDWQNLDKVVTRQLIGEYAAAVGHTLRGELMLGTARNKYLLGRVERTMEEIVATQSEMMRRGQFRPGFTHLEFGAEGRMPALRLTTPAGRDAVVRGAIDRVDVLPDGKHVAVFDYKLSAGPLSMQEVYYGLSLQLLTYLLVLQANGVELAGHPLTPVAAFYLPLARRLSDEPHPDEALEPNDPKFHLRLKPRGVFDADYFEDLDSTVSEGKSDVVAAHVKKGGGFGYRNSSDVADPAEFAALLSFVHRRLGELADEVVAGKVDITPYRINRDTPCPRCDYRSVCRFEPSINRYMNMQPMRREDVFVKITEGDWRE